MNFPQVFFGTLREHYIVLFSLAGGVALVAGFVGAWIGSHLASRRSASRVASELAKEVSGSPQFQQIMQAMDVCRWKSSDSQKGIASLPDFSRKRPSMIAWQRCRSASGSQST